MRRCSICGSFYQVQRHYKFHQDRWARKIYGKLIDHPKNIQWTCGNCHGSHKSPQLVHWTEREFCDAIGISPRSKEQQNRSVREGHIETSDISILKRYKKTYNPEELEGSVKTCSHCGMGKQYRNGRQWTPCSICRNLKRRNRI